MKTLRATKIKGWYECYRQPCPVCDKTGGCMINEAGTKAACIRVKSSKTFSKNSALPSYLHFLRDNQQPSVDASSIEQVDQEPKREDATLHHAYNSWLSLLELSDDHYKHLTGESRQLRERQIVAREYRSMPEKPWNSVKQLKQELGEEDFSGIPGFYLQDGKWGSYWTVRSIKGGILIPFRNHKNEIVGMQVRIDQPQAEVIVKSNSEKGNKLNARVVEQPNKVEVTYDGEVVVQKEMEFAKPERIEVDGSHVGMMALKKGQRYFWVSSAGKNKGSSPGDPSPVHVAVPSDELVEWQTGEKRQSKTVWLSEGPLKCDIAVDKIKALYPEEQWEDIGLTMLALPGVGAWRLALPYLKEMGVEKVNFCFDSDIMSNSYVLEHLKECMKELKALGYEGTIVQWSQKDGSGIDDLFLNKRLPIIKEIF